MKKIQPFFYIAVLAGLFLLAGIYLLILQLLPEPEPLGITVEPRDPDEGGVLYDLWFSSAELYELSVDHDLTGILFSTEKNTVSLLDQDRKLRWDKSFSTPPRQAKISSCGNYAAAGTAGGLLFFTSADLQFSWEDEGLPVDLVALAPNASWVAAARSDAESEAHYLDLFNQNGKLKWRIETGEISNLYLSREYLEQASIFYTHRQDDKPVFTALNLDGQELWSHEGQALVAVSRHGSRLAAVDQRNLLVYDAQGQVIWTKELPVEPKSVMFNPQNYNRLLVYGNQEGAEENLYYFDLADNLLWKKRVADGSLFSFTADGQHILCSSWRHYREDFTQMILLDRHGDEVNSWEVAMRVEKLAGTGRPHFVVVAGKDGYIDLINLEPLLAETVDEAATISIYNPVSISKRAYETMVLLYFTDENANLVPVSRTIGETDQPIQAALEELIRGPARGSALYRTIPEKDASVEVTFLEEKGRLELELSPELAGLTGTAQSRIALDSLLLTVSAFPRVEEIYLTVDNEPLEVFGEGLPLEQPLNPYRWSQPVYTPVMSGNRYYLKVREATLENAREADLQQLVEQSLLACRALPFVPATVELIDLRIAREKIQLNLSGQFKNIFREKGGEQEKLQAKLLLDALFMTVFENSRAQRVEILVEGESWIPPTGHPSLGRFFHHPYYINPEQ